jgi:hypothetical protein
VLIKVISGGQNGADQAGIMVAKQFGLQTGGHIPKGFRTFFGPDPALAEYGLEETVSDTYPPRTKRNVVNSQATVRFASNFATPGERLTIRICHELERPHTDIELNDRNYAEKAQSLAGFIVSHKIQVLNVAGNSDTDKRYGKHFYGTKQILTETFKILKAEGYIK